MSMEFTLLADYPRARLFTLKAGETFTAEDGTAYFDLMRDELDAAEQDGKERVLVSGDWSKCRYEGIGMNYLRNYMTLLGHPKGITFAVGNSSVSNMFISLLKNLWGYRVQTGYLTFEEAIAAAEAYIQTLE